MTQGRKCHEHDPLLFAVIPTTLFAKIRMRFNLNNGRFDPGRVVEGQEVPGE
jgi:hypothetical protein